MKLKTFFVFLVIVAIVVAEVSAAKQKEEGKKDKKGGKYDKIQGKKGKDKGKNKKEETVVEETETVEPQEEEVVVETKVNKKDKKKKRSVEENVCNCPAGPPGPEGPPGPKGECIYQPVPVNEPQSSCPTSIYVTEFNSVLALHSQTNTAPKCPLGQQTLWEGFSLIQMTANGKTVATNLGETDSCLPLFTMSLTNSCGIDGDCTAGQRNDRSYWMLTNATLGTEAILEADTPELISRCVVCDVAGPVIAVHSQTVYVPNCPAGWMSLWEGYSYVSSFASHSETDGGQRLSSAGSCLREVRKPLAVECNPMKGSCNVYEGQKDAWLKVASPAAQPGVTTSAEINISRCSVCVLLP